MGFSIESASAPVYPCRESALGDIRGVLDGLGSCAFSDVLCAPLGAKLAHGISPKRLSLLFGLFLMIAAGRLAIAEESFPSDSPIDCYDCEEWTEENSS